MKKKFVVLLASGFGAGLIPGITGTYGTVLGLFLAILRPDNIYLVTGAIIVGLWAAHEGEKVFAEHDSGKIVIDEVAGFLIAAYNWHGYHLITAFILFRIFDILKPGPIKHLQKLPGGFGVMADDLAAGLATNLVMRLAGFLFVMVFG